LLPKGSGCRATIRSYFEQFCPVAGVVFLAGQGAVRRAVVALPRWVCSLLGTQLLRSAEVARRLIAKQTSHRIASHCLQLREVSAATLAECGKVEAMTEAEEGPEAGRGRT
jgi:hypothetical protein